MLVLLLLSIAPVGHSFHWRPSQTENGNIVTSKVVELSAICVWQCVFARFGAVFIKFALCLFHCPSHGKTSVLRWSLFNAWIDSHNFAFWKATYKCFYTGDLQNLISNKLVNLARLQGFASKFQGSLVFQNSPMYTEIMSIKTQLKSVIDDSHLRDLKQKTIDFQSKTRYNTKFVYWVLGLIYKLHWF